ncbi:MAG: HAMP domain-containing protein [Deltaproteobacteria bacterium]|nr:HAMP domain-containing protein [Deltaproteobacteria bacterium]
MQLQNAPSGRIARLFAFGFGTVSVVAVAMCALLLFIIFDVSQLVSGMRHDEGSIEHGQELATEIREYSLLLSQLLVEDLPMDAQRIGKSRQKIVEHVNALSNLVPAAERWRIRTLQDETQEMRALLSRTKGAELNKNQVQLNAAELRKRSRSAAEHADIISRKGAQKMAHAHVLATDSTRLGLVGGGIFVLLVISLSIGFTLRLRAAVLRPLLVLTRAAERFGKGDFDARVGDVGKGELGALGDAFDHMAEELALREGRLLQSERMAAIGQLAAGVAHELNNPIGIIRGYLKTMSPDDDKETLGEELAILDEEAGHCQRIAADLLAYSSAGELVFEVVEADSFLRETAARFKEGSSSEAVIDVDASPANVEIDRARIRQVLLNLLLNAGQASPDNSTITMSAKIVAGTYEIRVSDQGRGIHDDDKLRIFEPFFSARRGGSGLGLSVCLGIVKAHQGFISVQDNESGRGVTFCVVLPLKARVASEDESAEDKNENKHEDEMPAKKVQQ